MPSEQPREGARVHELKTLPGFIDAIEGSGKTFEVRNNDRRFKTGDTLHLREYDPDEGYSGREIHRRVGYVLDGFPGIEKGYCVMALEPAQPQPREGEARVEWACTNPECSFPSADETMNCPRCLNMLTRVLPAQTEQGEGEAS